MKEVLLDTNFLTMPHTLKIDIFTELEKIILEQHKLIVVSGTIKELTELSKGNKEVSVAARVALKLLKERGLDYVESSGNVDDALISYASSHENAIVCTNDKHLKKKLKEVGAEVVCLSGKNKLIRV